MTDLKQLETFLAAGHPCVRIVTTEESYAREIVTAAAMTGSRRLYGWSATRGVNHGLFADSESKSDTEHPAAALYYFANKIEHPVMCVAFDLSDHLEDARTLRALRDVIAAFRETESSLILIDHTDQLPDVVRAEATQLELSLPDDEELEKILRSTVSQQHRKSPIVAQLKSDELEAIIRNMRGLNRTQAEQVVIDCVADDRTLDSDDISHILARKRARLQHGGVLEFVEAPVDLDQIGGLRRLKQWLKHRRNAFDDEAIEFGLSAPRGVLLLGVQGAGKSLASKAIATAWQRPLLRLDPGALYDRFVGASEQRLRSTLHQAEMMAPIILWIDEIEKGFASAASRSTDGGLSQRMFGTLLTWMQDHEAPVFIVATANNIDALPPELLRKGRFDEIFFVDLPNTEVRRIIFAIHLKKRNRNPETFDLDALADASEGYSGAEIEQALLAALHKAFGDSTEVTTERIITALQESPPLSVTMAEKISRLRSWASERCVFADFNG